MPTFILFFFYFKNIIWWNCVFCQKYLGKGRFPALPVSYSTRCNQALYACMNVAKPCMDVCMWMQPLSPSHAVPDMSSLTLIKESDIQRGKVIGSGAFGTVYEVW